MPKKLSNKSGIYSITNSVDNRFYIGSTVCFSKRFRDHRYRLIRREHYNKYLQSFSNKYGVESMSFNILYLCKNTCLVYNEKLWIDTFNPQFNLKKIINRPYFDDEIAFNLKNYKSPFERMFENEDGTKNDFYYRFMNFSNDKKETIRKQKNIIKPKNINKIKLSKFPKERKRQLNEIIKQLKKQ
ncbi:MAG: GIY-YIG nuclease family protein [Nanoarchaeota archaeon]